MTVAWLALLFVSAPDWIDNESGCTSVDGAPAIYGVGSVIGPSPKNLALRHTSAQNRARGNTAPIMGEIVGALTKGYLASVPANPAIEQHVGQIVKAMYRTGGNIARAGDPIEVDDSTYAQATIRLDDWLRQIDQEPDLDDSVRAYMHAHLEEETNKVCGAAPPPPPPPVVERHYTFADSHSRLFGHVVQRDGFHFQFGFGIGGGPDNEGLAHTMEVGGTLQNGWTIALLHMFTQNNGVIGAKHGPDLLGGWMAEVKTPIFFPELEAKVALGFGGIHDQTNGINAYWGLGFMYGLDFNIPVFATSGPMLGLQAVHVIVYEKHFMSLSLVAGWSWY